MSVFELRNYQPLTKVPKSTREEAEETVRDILGLANYLRGTGGMSSGYLDRKLLGAFKPLGDSGNTSRINRLRETHQNHFFTRSVRGLVTNEKSSREQSAIDQAVNRWNKKRSRTLLLSDSIGTFLVQAQKVERIGAVDSAIDLINDAIDELFRRGHFAHCDVMLTEINPKEFSTDLLLAILTATLVAKQKLRNRTRFFRVVENEIKSRKDYERGLLDGLE